MDPFAFAYMLTMAFNICALVLFLLLLFFSRIRKQAIRFGFILACILFVLEIYETFGAFVYKSISPEFYALIIFSFILNMPFFIAFILKTHAFITFWSRHKYKFIKK